MKIDLIPRVKPIKKWPYKLSHEYNPIVQKYIEEMLVVGIIYPINKSEWESPMVVQNEKSNINKIRISVKFLGVNKLTITNPFPMPFVNEIINEVAGNECHSFTDRFLGYNQVPIAKEDHGKITFVSEFKSFTYRVMSFGLNNVLVIFSQIVVIVFQGYIYKQWLCTLTTKQFTTY
jgi:putative transposase